MSTTSLSGSPTIFEVKPDIIGNRLAEAYANWTLLRRRMEFQSRAVSETKDASYRSNSLRITHSYGATGHLFPVCRSRINSRTRGVFL